MFWSGSGAFIRRHAETGDAHYFSWTVSFASRASGNRWLDVLHLSCSRQPLGPPEEPRTGEIELRLAAPNSPGGDGTDRLLCFRASARAIDLWIAAAGPVPRSGRRVRHQDLPPAARPAIEDGAVDGMPLPDGGTFVLDGPGTSYHG